MEDPPTAIIFCNTKADVRFITAYLSKRGFNIDQISGDLPQSARERAIAKIKQGKLRYLVATDVAARGIDISDLAYVVNYTTSDSPEVYVHRTGRTGRAGKSGVAISLISGLDIGNFKFMQTVNGTTIKEKKIPTERAVARRLEKRKAEEAEETERKEQEAELDTLRERADEDLAAISADDAEARIGRMRVYVDQLAENEEGRAELARFAAAYLVARPAKAEPAPVQSEAADDDLGLPEVEDRETERAREDAERGEEGGERKRRGRGRRSGGGSGRGGGDRGGRGGGERRRR